MSETRILSQSGVLTTAHIFQDAYIKDYLEESKAINLSGNNTMKRNYNIGQSIEYAIFIPISLINNLQQRSLISTETISKMNVNGAFETINLDKDLLTQMIGATSNDINLQESLMQEGDSGSLVFQRQNEKLNISGIQFGYAKNSNTPMTIMWRLKKSENGITTTLASVAWLKNRENIIVWDTQGYLLKNCFKIQAS